MGTPGLCLYPRGDKQHVPRHGRTSGGGSVTPGRDGAHTAPGRSRPAPGSPRHTCQQATLRGAWSCAAASFLSGCEGEVDGALRSGHAVILPSSGRLALLRGLVGWQSLQSVLRGTAPAPSSSPSSLSPGLGAQFPPPGQSVTQPGLRPRWSLVPSSSDILGFYDLGETYLTRGMLEWV